MSAAKVCALVGHPVERSLSPALFEAAFRALGLPHRYELLPSPGAEDARRAFARLASGALAGLNVTAPHKRLALAAAARATPEAAACGAANVLAASGEGSIGLIAHNTDALALLDLLRARLVRPGGALVIGAGGAALAAVWAAHAAGLAPITVTTRAWADGPPELDPRAADARRAGGDPRAPAELAELAGDLAAILHATPAGSRLGVGAASAATFLEALPWGALRGGTLAVDVVYRPRSTPFLRLARGAGLAGVEGIEMLILQAFRGLSIWFAAELGARPDGPALALAAMRAAAATALDAEDP